MTSLRRGKDLGAESERGPKKIGEDKAVSGTERVRNLSSVGTVARCRLGDGVSGGR